MLHFACEKCKVILPEFSLAGKLLGDVHGLEHSGTVRGKISVENRGRKMGLESGAKKESQHLVRMKEKRHKSKGMERVRRSEKQFNASLLAPADVGRLCRVIQPPLASKKHTQICSTKSHRKPDRIGAKSSGSISLGCPSWC